MENEDLYWQSYLNIEEEVLKLTDYVYIKGDFDDPSLASYSIISANLLIRICVQIESLSKKIYYDLINLMDSKTRAKPDYNKTENETFFDKDCLRLIDKTYNLDDKVVNIITPKIHLDKKCRQIKPLKESELSRKGKWQKAYQAVKHNYATELCQGNIKNVLFACAGLYLLNIYNRFKASSRFHGLSLEKIEDIDYSFGSKIFSIDKPKIPEKITDINISVSSSSPFVVKATESSYHQTMQLYKKSLDDTQSNIYKLVGDKKQEYDEFVHNYKPISTDIKLNRIAYYYLWVFNEAAPKNLSFDERKDKFLSLNIVKDNVNTLFSSTNPSSEITEENIDSKIEHFGFTLGLIKEAQLVVHLYMSAHYDMDIEPNKDLW